MNSSVHSLEIQLFQPDPAMLYSIDAAAALLGLSRRMIALCCKHALIETITDPASGVWFFDEEALRTLRRVEALHDFCGGNLDAVRMILALQDEVGRLRAELRFWRG